jgi:hypothetical protein
MLPCKATQNTKDSLFPAFARGQILQYWCNFGVLQVLERNCLKPPSHNQKKRGPNFAPSSQGKLRNQTFAAKATLWNVEYSASNFFTVGTPSINLATIFSICG